MGPSFNFYFPGSAAISTIWAWIFATDSLASAVLDASAGIWLKESTSLRYIISYCIILYYIILYSIILYFIILYSSIFYFIIVYHILHICFQLALLVLLKRSLCFIGRCPCEQRLAGFHGTRPLLCAASDLQWFGLTMPCHPTCPW